MIIKRDENVDMIEALVRLECKLDYVCTEIRDLKDVEKKVHELDKFKSYSIGIAFAGSSIIAALISIFM